MKVYVDLVFLLNIYLDFLLLITTSVTLKRNASLKRIGLGTLLGSTSIFFLFWSINNILLFFIKIAIAIGMVLISFGYKDIKYLLNNLGYFYMISIILGGFLYYLNLEFSYAHIGMIFINNGISINWLVLCLFSPFILYIYYRQSQKMKSTYNLNFRITIMLRNKQKIEVNAFLDTGNKLVDPITNKPVILLQKNCINIEQEPILYVPYNSLNNHNLLKCIKPLYIEINNKKFKNYLIGISDKKFHLDGVECILNNKLMEEIT